MYDHNIKYFESLGKYPNILQDETHIVENSVQFNINRYYRKLKIIIW